MVHEDPAPRGGPRHRQRLQAAPAAAAAADLRPVLHAVSGLLHAEAVQQELRSASRQLVRAEPSRRGLRRDLRRLADAGRRLAARATRTGRRSRSSSTWTRSCTSSPASRQVVRTRRQGRAAARRSARRCARTTSASGGTTASTIRTSTIATCAGCSRIAPNTSGNMKAARFIARVRKDVRRMVAAWTGEYQYTIDQVLENMIKPCQRAEPRASRPRGSDASSTSRSCSPCRR